VEQLGYIVSAFTRRVAGGGWGFSVVVQSSVALPEVLEERVEAWIKSFRDEVFEMDPERIAMEAAAVASQLKERDTKLSQEVGAFWGEIVNTETYSSKLREPAFDRIERIADELVVKDESKGRALDTTINGNERMTPEVMKEKLLGFIDKYISATPSRRAMSARIYNQEAKDVFESNRGKPGILSNFADIRHIKQFLSAWPIAPYWRHQD
jgi:hypothetical protein